MNPAKGKGSRTGWLLLILLAAVFLRLHDLSGTPPGLTHDEADHGITALQVINGERAIYFTVGYGREPLFDYSAALLMYLIGPTYLAPRLTAIFFSLVLIASTFAWVRRAFDERVALYTVAGIALGFWAVMTSRQSLRSVTLPALLVPAFYLYWRGSERIARFASSLRFFVPAGLLLGLTFYTYLPARILWLLFPLAAACRRHDNKPANHYLWRATGLVLLIAGLVASPLFFYLINNPQAETRISQLSGPMELALKGKPGTLIANASSSLRIFTSSGDPSWRYNLAGRPLLQPLMGALFYIGLGVALWQLFTPANRERRARYAISLGWLGLGMAPVLVTGPELSTTQGVGMQPLLYLFPALGIQLLSRLGQRTLGLSGNAKVESIALALLFAGTGIHSGFDYFTRWGKAPEVRVQYESAMVAAMRYLRDEGAGAAAVSTVTPNPLHTPAVAKMVIPEEAGVVRWFDGRHSLVLPASSDVLAMFPGFAPLAPELTGYLDAAKVADIIPQPMTDIDRPLTAYRLDGIELGEAWQRQFERDLPNLKLPANFGDTLDFLGYQLDATEARTGETVSVVTLWRVQRPAENALLFTHLQGDDGLPVAQVDRLDVPGSSWKPGDLFIQLHQLQLSVGLEAGEYPIVVGLCQGISADCVRVPILGQGESGDLLPLAMLTILP